MMSLDEYKTRLGHADVRLLDEQFAHFIQQLEPSYDALALIGFVLSAHLGKGHVCLDFSQPHEYLNTSELQYLFQSLAKREVVLNVPYEAQSAQLLTPIANKPLVLHGSRLYLQRYWQYETQLAHAIQHKLTTNQYDVQSQQGLIAQLFALQDGHNPLNWQALAACMAVMQGFCVISGGPGTGKTTTVIRLLALLIAFNHSEKKSRPIIKLVAPTGKAAMRLTQSISAAKSQLDVSDEVKNGIPEHASTVHRLLKSDGQGGFKHHSFNPLHLDVLIVDEASMIDLPMMAKLLAALPEHAKLILLGDKDQLASVEAGSVLADICDSETVHGYSDALAHTLTKLTGMALQDHVESDGALLRDHICHLRKSYRFDADSGIGHLAKAANKGSIQDWRVALSQGFNDICLMSLSNDQFDAFIKQSGDHYCDYLQHITGLMGEPTDAGISDAQAHEIHQRFSQFQILCALREGPLGVSGINALIEGRLQMRGMIDLNQTWYIGRPVMIMQNDYGLNLYNGDIGLVLLHKNDDGHTSKKVAFIGADQQVRWLQPSRLPAHETVYAMTVHKSQGSEFEHCALVLPDHNTQVLTKELIYTGITRAKKQLTCIGDARIIEHALSRQVQRASGLRQRLWQTQTPVKTNAEPLLPTDDSQFSLF